MAISSIFMEESQVQQGGRPELAGLAALGFVDERGNVQSVENWIFTLADREVASAIAELYGGAPEETNSPKDHYIRVFTERPSVPILLSGPEALAQDFKMWANKQLTHHCDGRVYLSPDNRKGRACGCPPTLDEILQNAKDGIGPKPEVRVTFSLMDDEELGTFQLKTGSTVFARSELFRVASSLDRIGGPAVADMEIVQVTTKSRKQFKYPNITNIRSYSDAVAEPRG